MRHPLVLNLLRYRYILMAVLAFGISVKLLADAFNHSLVNSPIMESASSSLSSEEVLVAEEAPQAIGYVALLERPLFSRTRRPYVPPPPEPPAVEQPQVQPEIVTQEPQVSLQGIFIQGRTRRALVLTPENALPAWVNEGANISGWKLSEIKPNQLILLAGSQRRIIELYVEKSQLNGN